MKEYTRRGIPSFPFPHRAARAISAMAQYARYLGQTRPRQIA
ncbi:MAG: hypothetical protein ACE5IA_07420 [Dehalococcoidia bacterium]